MKFSEYFPMISRHVRTFDLSFIGLVPALLACTALMVAARDGEGDLLAAVGL